MPVITNRGGQITQRGLGMGLGLNRNQQQRVANAMSTQDLSGLNPRLQARVQNRMTGATGNAQQQGAAQGLWGGPGVNVQGQQSQWQQPQQPMQSQQPRMQPIQPQMPTGGGGQAKGGGGPLQGTQSAGSMQTPRSGTILQAAQPTGGAGQPKG